MRNYYNENDPHAAAWLRQLIADGLIPDGDVDDRSIEAVTPKDLWGYTQVHFFAGIGGWAEALRLAGWPSGRPVWTGSCPCQPFSTANKSRRGLHDKRHLWPQMRRLIAQCRPPVVFGEQVASAVSQGWMDEVASDLEAAHYAFGSAVLRACDFGAGHERKRLFWVADSSLSGWERFEPDGALPSFYGSGLPVHDCPLALARSVLAEGRSDLLSCDGLSLRVEQSAIKGYGNAIVPKPAAAFIRAVIEARSQC